MAVDVARPPARPAPVRALALREVPARVVLGAIVAVSFAVRVAVALGHALPLYFPDEYIYSSLARSLAEDGRPLVRGGAAHFPALLEPLLAAPFHLFADPALAYRLTQAENALAMSLAAVPVFLLSRRLGLARGLALVAAALAVLVPDLFYVSAVLADPIAYPLVLGAVYAAVCVLDRPTRANQVAFLACAGLAAFARVQYVVLPVVLLAAALVVERGRVLRVARSLRLTLAVLAVPVAGALALGPGRLLGYYSGVADLGLSPGALAHWVVTDALLLAYAAGFVLVPGALVGILGGLVRPRSRAESAFAAVATALAVCLFAEAALYAANGSHRFQERYLFALLGLVAPAFGLQLSRVRGRTRVAVALAAAGLLVLAARIPLSGFTVADAKQDSPFLFAVFRVEQSIGLDDGALLVALVAGVLAVVAAAVAWRPRLAPVALGLAVASSLAAGAGAVDFAHRNANGIRSSFLPADARWVDDARVGPVDLLETRGAPPERTLEQLFWNRSLRDVLLLDGAEPPDVFRTRRVATARDGRLLLDGRPLRHPFLLDRYGVELQLAGAERLRTSPSFELWRPVGTPRVRLLASGRFHDGWLARAGRIVVYPDAAGRTTGTLRLPLGLQPGTHATPLRLRADGIDRTIVLRPGETKLVRVAVDARGPWTLRWSTEVEAVLDGRHVSVQSASPSFTRAARPPRPDAVPAVVVV